MRFDKTGDDKLIRDIVLGSLRTDADRNLGDAPLRDADVDDLRLASGDADIAKDQVEGHVVKRQLPMPESAPFRAGGLVRAIGRPDPLFKG